MNGKENDSHNSEEYFQRMTSLIDSSTMYLYKWRHSHFTLLETLSTDNANDIFTYTAESFAVVVTVSYATSNSHRTLLNVYILTGGNELRHVQTFYINAVKVFPITLDNGFYFYSVSHSGMFGIKSRVKAMSYRAIEL